MSAAQAPAAAAKQNPLQQLLSVNQQLTGQFLQANQLFVQGNPLISQEPTPPPSSSLLNLYSQLIENARPPDTFGNPVSELIGGAKEAAGSAVSSAQSAVLGTPLAGAIQAVAQTNQLFVSAQSQIQSLLGNSLFSQQLGLPVNGATPAVTPGVLPFNLVNAMLGLLSTPLPMQAQGQGPGIPNALKIPNVPILPNVPKVPSVPKVPNIPGTDSARALDRLRAAPKEPR